MNDLDRSQDHAPTFAAVTSGQSVNAELLAALKALQLQALQSPDLLRSEWGQDALDAARAAIAKASRAEPTVDAGPGTPS